MKTLVRVSPRSSVGKNRSKARCTVNVDIRVDPYDGGLCFVACILYLSNIQRKGLVGSLPPSRRKATTVVSAVKIDLHLVWNYFKIQFLLIGIRVLLMQFVRSCFRLHEWVTV